MSIPLSTDETAVLSALTAAGKALSTVEIGDLANPLPAADDTASEHARWYARSLRFEAAEQSLHIRALIAGSAAGWRVTTAGHAALMAALETTAPDDATGQERQRELPAEAQPQNPASR